MDETSPLHFLPADGTIIYSPSSSGFRSFQLSWLAKIVYRNSQACAQEWLHPKTCHLLPVSYRWRFFLLTIFFWVFSLLSSYWGWFSNDVPPVYLHGHYFVRTLIPTILQRGLPSSPHFLLGSGVFSHLDWQGQNCLQKLPVMHRELLDPDTQHLLPASDACVALGVQFRIHWWLAGKGNLLVIYSNETCRFSLKLLWHLKLTKTILCKDKICLFCC